MQIGVLEVDGEKLKRLKSGTLPLVIVLSCNTLLKAAIQKHTKHFKQFNKYADYILLYPDQSIVQKLPGSSEDSFCMSTKRIWASHTQKCIFIHVK